MSRHTIVLEFDSGEPSYSAGMELLGGCLVAVAFADELERAEQLELQRDELLEALESAQMALAGYTHQNDITKAALAKAQASIASARGEP